MSRHLNLFAVAALALFAASCAVNPATGKREFTLVSQAQEKQIGAEAHKGIVAEYGVYGDAALTARIDSIGQALAQRSELPNLGWTFTLLDDPVVNAFALPGGYIYITRGILAHLNSDAQLAGVIGHEIGHVTARHSAQRITYQQLAGLGLGIASIASETFARYSELAQTGMQLMFLKYGRDDENQADELGVRYATAAGYDPRQIPGTYSLLARTGERAGQSLPGFLSTHPDPGDRENRTRTLAAEAAAGKSGLIVNSRGFILRLDGLVFGVNPQHGYFDGRVFYHPDMRFQVAFPEGWQHQNTQSAVLAGTQDQSAVMQLTLAAAGDFTPEGYVAELLRRGSISGADGRSETIGGYPAWIGVLTTTNQGASMRLVAAFIRQTPERTLQILGRSRAAGDPNEAAILASARSLRPLTDAGRLNASPARVDVLTATEQATFSDFISTHGPQGIGLEETAILNGTYAEETVRRNELVKVVRPSKLQ